MNRRESLTHLSKLIKDYLSQLRKIASDPDATDELSLRPALSHLLTEIPACIGQAGMQSYPLSEPKRRLYGTPDFRVKTIDSKLVGYVEAKGIEDNLREVEATNQIDRYKSAGQRLILTNHLEFVLFDWNEHGDKADIFRVDTVRLLSKKELLSEKAPAEYEIESLLRLFERFFRDARPAIKNASELADRLAHGTRLLYDLLQNAYQQEPDKGDLHKLCRSFEKTLMPGIKTEQFCDMYAQTITYGLFAARCNHDNAREPFSRRVAAYDIPRTNPFLRKLFEYFTGTKIEDQPYCWIVDDIASLLGAVDVETIVSEILLKKGKDDPIVHFYETFLSKYNPTLREMRGVYYTPQSVVSYIVRSVDTLLRERFQCKDGLADTSTIKIKDTKRKEIEYPRVLVLDPACGTGTFLFEIVNHLYEKFTPNRGLWNSYVSKHLLPRLFGFELLMAPYSVAHLKLGLQLASTGYNISNDTRLGVYLTNTLEEAARKAEELFEEWISEEADTASHIKREAPIMVVVGNPPYSGHSANKGDWIRSLVADYKKDCPELSRPAQSKWLQDDYVKFIRFAQWRVERTGSGILAFITNHSYLSNPTFRGMRKSLSESFDEIYILNLHGSAKTHEKSPDGSTDQNVFDIQQGVAIGIFVRSKEGNHKAKVFHSDLWGSRDFKYNYLTERDVKSTDWATLDVEAPGFLFIPQDKKLYSEFQSFPSLTAIFDQNGTPAPGIITTHDEFAISWNEKEVEDKVATFLKTNSEKEAREIWRLCSQSQWDYQRAKRELAKGEWKSQVVPILYRPFDWRWTVYNSNIAVHRRERVMQHLLSRKNIALYTCRQVAGAMPWRHVLVTRDLVDDCYVSNKTKERGFVLPLYLRTHAEVTKKQIGFDFRNTKRGTKDRSLNLNPEYLATLQKQIGLTFTEQPEKELGFSAENVFHYIYAILHSLTYRARYQEFLRAEFPRIPFPFSKSLFTALSQLGADLVACHLLEDRYEFATWNRKDGHSECPFEKLSVTYPIAGNNIVDAIRFSSASQSHSNGRIWINKKQHFENVPSNVWDFQVGSYRVAEKWLKDRKHRTLSYDDILHYQKTLASLSQTLSLAKDIDAQIEKSGGWSKALGS